MSEVDKLAERMVKRYKEKTPESASDWLEGCRETTEDPIKRALEENDKRIANLLASIKQKTWETKMSRLSKEDWLKGVEASGEEAFRSGVEKKGVKKYSEKAPKLARIAIEAKNKARAIKVKTLEDALKRVRVVVETWKKYKGQI